MFFFLPMPPFSSRAPADAIFARCRSRMQRCRRARDISERFLGRRSPLYAIRYRDDPTLRHTSVHITAEDADIRMSLLARDISHIDESPEPRRHAFSDSAPQKSRRHTFTPSLRSMKSPPYAAAQHCRFSTLLLMPYLPPLPPPRHVTR